MTIFSLLNSRHYFAIIKTFDSIYVSHKDHRFTILIFFPYFFPTLNWSAAILIRFYDVMGVPSLSKLFSFSLSQLLLLMLPQEKDYFHRKYYSYIRKKKNSQLSGLNIESTLIWQHFRLSFGYLYSTLAKFLQDL